MRHPRRKDGSSATDKIEPSHTAGSGKNDGFKPIQLSKVTIQLFCYGFTQISASVHVSPPLVGTPVPVKKIRKAVKVRNAKRRMRLLLRNKTLFHANMDHNGANAEPAPTAPRKRLRFCFFRHAK